MKIKSLHIEAMKEITFTVCKGKWQSKVLEAGASDVQPHWVAPSSRFMREEDNHFSFLYFSTCISSLPLLEWKPSAPMSGEGESNSGSSLTFEGAVQGAEPICGISVSASRQSFCDIQTQESTDSLPY